MNATTEDRRELKRELEEHPLVDDVDFTRDGFKTLVLRLRDSAGGEP